MARAYAEIHETRQRGSGFSLAQWFAQTFPQTFRRHSAVFRLSCAIFGAGCLFGLAAMALDPAAKRVLVGDFGHLAGDPAQRVAEEERGDSRGVLHARGAHGQFASFLMTHNTQVSITTMALGMTYGIGTVILSFYNGVILGAVC